MTTAIIYTRFSTLEQRDGVTLERQVQRCNDLAIELGLEVEKTITDAGKSGFIGKHRINGAGMANFEKEVLAGHHVGKTLLIEKISRLSREDPNESYDLMRSLTKNGVTVACWDKRAVYHAYQNPDFFALIEYFIIAKTVHEESAAKADFGNDKWSRRREDMRGGKIASKMGPAWLRLKDDRSGWHIVGEGKGPKIDRGLIVKRIFEMADDGLGSVHIARMLNSEAVPVWPRFAGKDRDRTPAGWQRTFITRLLKNRAVTGEFQPMQYDADRNSVPAGDPIRDYYPRVVEPDLFERVSGTAASRAGVRGRRSSVVVNLVSGLCVCEDCGGPMEYASIRRAGAAITKNGVKQAPLKFDTASLVCRNARARHAEASEHYCDNRRNIAYLGLERALLDSCLHLAMDDKAFAQPDVVAGINVRIADLRRGAELATKKAETLWEAYAEDASPMALKLAKKAEADAADQVEEIAKLEEERRTAGGEASAAAHLSRLAVMREKLYDDDLEVRAINRSMVATGLRSVIDRVICQPDGASVVQFKHGLRMVRLIPGRGRRPASFQEFDLAKPDRDRSYMDTADRAVVDSFMARREQAKKRG